MISTFPERQYIYSARANTYTHGHIPRYAHVPKFNPVSRVPVTRAARTTALSPANAYGDGCRTNGARKPIDETAVGRDSCSADNRTVR